MEDCARSSSAAALPSAAPRPCTARRAVHAFRSAPPQRSGGGAGRAEGRADWNIPMRPDHGQDILDDLGRRGQPGYPTIGRLKGLAELRGVMRTVDAFRAGRVS